MFRLFVRSAAIAAGVVVGAAAAMAAVVPALGAIAEWDVARRRPFPPADDRGRPLSPLTGKRLDLGGARP